VFLVVPAASSLEGTLDRMNGVAGSINLLTPSLLRLYLAVCMVAMAQLLFHLACPPLLRDYGTFVEWQHNSGEYSHRIRALIRQEGQAIRASLIDRLKSDYHTRREELNTSRVSLRAALTLLYGVASVLVAFTFVTHLIRVFSDPAHLRLLVR
jgi:hypothetical protein